MHSSRAHVERQVAEQVKKGIHSTAPSLGMDPKDQHCHHKMSASRRVEHLRSCLCSAHCDEGDRDLPAANRGDRLLRRSDVSSDAPSARAYSDEDARRFLDRFGGGSDLQESLALRSYTSQLIGGQKDLVLHGGGNTSVKVRTTTTLGKEVECLAVKGSGWNLDSIEPAGFPLVELQHLHNLLDLDELSDTAMTNELRTHLLDPNAPSPSVEALTHALLPGKFVDHSHADAICTLTDRDVASATQIAHQVRARARRGGSWEVRRAIFSWGVPMLSFICPCGPL